MDALAERPRIVDGTVDVIDLVQPVWDVPDPRVPRIAPAVSAASTRVRHSCALNARALALWPGLDRRALARRGCDTKRVAAYVSRRTSLPLEAIIALLTAAGEPDPAIG